MYRYMVENRVLGYGEYIGERLGRKNKNEMILMIGSTTPKDHSIKVMHGRYGNVVESHRKVLNDGYVVDKGDHYEFIKNFICSCPNVAACILRGKIVTDGTRSFINDEGKSLFEVMNR